MAEENKDENESKGGIVKIAIMVVSGIVLLGIGLGLGMFLGGEDTDPSSEITQIIEKKENPDENENNEEVEENEEVECTEEEKDEEGNCPTGPKKMPKIVPEEEIFATTYYEFPGNFTTNLKGSKKFLQISVGVSTQYDDTVMALAIGCEAYRTHGHSLTNQRFSFGELNQHTHTDETNWL